MKSYDKNLTYFVNKGRYIHERFLAVFEEIMNRGIEMELKLKGIELQFDPALIMV
jgi:hypothetical protein